MKSIMEVLKSQSQLQNSATTATTSALTTTTSSTTAKHLEEEFSYHLAESVMPNNVERYRDDTTNQDFEAVITR